MSPSFKHLLYVQENEKKPSSATISDMLSEVEAYCTEHGLTHFLMSAADDVQTIQAAFKRVINSSMQISLKKRRQAFL